MTAPCALVPSQIIVMPLSDGEFCLLSVLAVKAMLNPPTGSAAASSGGVHDENRNATANGGPEHAPKGRKTRGKKGGADFRHQAAQMIPHRRMQDFPNSEFVAHEDQM